MDWVQNHWADIWTILTTTVTLASLIVKLTPSDKDDKLVMKIIGLLALNKTK